MNLPRETRIDRKDTHRLIPSKHLHNQASVLAEVADDDSHLHDIFDLEGITNTRLQAEHGGAIGISTLELVTGFPHYRVVNAAFCHPHPLGSRFNDETRGAWYAAFEFNTSLEEVIFHKTRALAEIGIFQDEATYDDYLADFHGSFHDIRNDQTFADCLEPESYNESQKLAQQLLRKNSAGIVYPSVRKPRGTNVACFRPALVANVRRGKTITLIWKGKPRPVVWR